MHHYSNHPSNHKSVYKPRALLQFLLNHYHWKTLCGPGKFLSLSACVQFLLSPMMNKVPGVSVSSVDVNKY